ncbi:MAG TPA: winged helix-turn-helix transcriptional regulator [Methylomirabilota bacterium]|jgi:DNA-binding MarR family transcriptional regulator|nr:winged helix-turn-helix transcriptional regulator [Methylomirabilota bacterium]
MERDQERNLEILSAIDESDVLTQRALAQRLGVALGLTNLYLKRLALKGYIKVTEFPRKPAARKRLRYLLTPKGLTEKTRLAAEFMGRSLTVYRQARETLREALAHLGEKGHKRIALYGTGEAAEIAYLTLREFGLEPVGVFDVNAGGLFLGMKVRDIRELAGEDVDRVIVATFDRPKVHVPVLTAAGVPADRLVFLHPARRTNGAR